MPSNPSQLDVLNAALAERYEIVRELGRGGMATVYLARDPRHDRLVALKVLDPDLGVVLGAERFLSEIRVTANLQHPNLLPLFDSGEANGLLYYVMPYIEGETLRHRLDRERQLPVDEAVRIATAIAGALDYAHQHGVIHRDLKPENILLQHGQPVVADFGIALAISNAGGQRVTQTGLSLGTPQYMSPEQATGDRVIDARADIYSLGAVTYEMLAGEPPHAGSTAQAIIAKLMTESPRPLAVLRPSVPEYLDDAVCRALEKVPADRFATAGQFAAALSDESTPHRARSTRAGKARSAPRALRIGLVAASALAVTFAGLWMHASSRDDARLLQFVVDVPSDQQVALVNESSVAVSPDGRMIAYVARSKSATAPQIFIRPLDSLQARPEAIQGASPRFSPDGRWLYYRTLTAIMRVPVHGGSPESVTSLGAWQGYALSSRGDVVFSEGGSIWRVGDKGAHVKLVSPDAAKGEQSFAQGGFLDDNTVSFWIQRGDGDQGRALGITTPQGGAYSVVSVPGTRTFAMLDGHILVGTEEGTLLGYPFDLGRRVVTGPPVVLLDSVVWIIAGASQLSIGADGTLAYLRGKWARSLAISDKHGATIAEAPERAAFGRAELSPDGKRAAVAVTRSATGGRNIRTSDIWTWDIDAKTMARFTVDGGSIPAWSPDGQRIAFAHGTAPGHADIMWAPTDGSAPPELLVKIPDTLDVTGFSFARGGREMLVDVRRPPSTISDIYTVDLSGSDRALRTLVATRFDDRQGTLSPDGQWLAYVSNESGRDEVYVRPYATAAGRIRVSTNGGNAPTWIAGGSRLVYSQGVRSAVVEIAQSRGTITAIVRDSLGYEGVRQDIDGKGERILVEREPAAWRLVVVKNWAQDARKKLRSGVK